MNLTELEKENGRKAFEAVKAAGGKVSFDEYDAIMSPVRYFVPVHWGWAGTHGRKSCADKLCAFAACKMGLLKQVNNTYETTQQSI